MGFLSKIGSGLKSIGKSIVGGVKSLASGLSSGSGILGTIGSALGGIPGALIGGAVDLGSNWLTNEFLAKPNAEDAFQNNLFASAQAFDRSYDAYKQRYQDTMADMKAAGLNPILAAGSGGFNVSGQPTMAKADAPMATLPNTSSAQSYMNMEQAQTEISSRKEKLEKAANIYQDSLKKVEETALAAAKTEQEITKTRLIIKNIELTSQNIWKAAAEFQKTIQEGYESAARQKEIEQRTTMIRNEIKKLKSQLKEIVQGGRIYEGPAGLLLKSIKEAFDAMNLHFVFGAGLP